MVAHGAHNLSHVWSRAMPARSQKWVTKTRNIQSPLAKHSAAKSVTEIALATVAASIASRRGFDLDARLQDGEKGPWAWDLCWRKSIFLSKALEQPSAEIALASCVVLGCVVSSYLNRNHAHDRYQSMFFLIAGSTVAGTAIATDASKQLVLLVYVPWAACLAMAASSAAHALWRQLVRPEPNQLIQADEKGMLL